MTRPRGPLVGIATFGAMLLAFLFWGLLMMSPGLLVKPLPIPALRRGCRHYLSWAAARWVGSNRLIFRLLHAPRWRLHLDPRIGPPHSYLVIGNHQSWADIPILLDALHGRAEFPRFFLKRELLWVPLLGLLCWGLDMPFMRRRRPGGAVAASDLDITRSFCARFRGEPVTVVNFVEGTRSTAAKRAASGSPYRHLLRPKTGGLAFTLGAMGEQFAGLVDVTLAYQSVPAGRSLLWSFLCGEQADLCLDAALVEVPPAFVGPRQDTDPEHREQFQQWLNGLWLRKDRLIDALTGLSAETDFNSQAGNR